jgi:hypothetical protein
MTEREGAEKGCRSWFDKLTMRLNEPVMHSLILSLSKDEAASSRFSASSRERGALERGDPA